MNESHCNAGNEKGPPTPPQIVAKQLEAHSSIESHCGINEDKSDLHWN